MKLSRFINIRIVFVLIFFSLFTYSRLFCTINYALSPEAHALLIVELEKDNDQKHIVDLLRNEKKYFDQIKEINITIKIEISRKLENLSEKVKIRVLEVQKNENFIFSSISKYTKNEISNAKDLFNMSISHYTEKELNLETLTQRKSKLTQSNSIDVLTPSIFTSDEQKQKFITNLKNANSYLTDLAALKIKLIDKKIQLAQIHVVLANIEKESAMRIFELKDKSQVVTEQDIKRTEIIVDEKQKDLDKSNKTVKTAIKEAEKKEKEAEKLKTQAQKQIGKARNEKERISAELKIQVGNEKLAESESSILKSNTGHLLLQTELENIKNEKYYYQLLYEIQQTDFNDLLKLEKKKELLLKVDSLTSQHELIKKKIDSNSTITQNLGLRLKEYSTRKKHEKVYKDKSSLRTIISSIKSQIKNRRQIELDLSKIKLLYEKSSSSFNDIINKHLFPKTKNVSILDKTDTKYEFSDIIAIAKFYKAQFLNLKKNWDSFSLEISILIRRPKNFSNIPLKIYLTILALVLLMIARKLITVNIRNKFLYMESLNKRLWNDDYKWRDITISMLRILKKGVPFLMTLISLLIITFVLHLNKSVFSMLLFLYFSIFLYYLLKYIIIEILIPDKLISKHIFFYTHIFFLISLIFLNFINITQIMAPEININILYLIYQGIFALFLGIVLYKKEIFEQLIPESKNIIYSTAREFVINFYPLLIISIISMIFLYMTGFIRLFLFIIKGIFLTILLILSRIFLRKRLSTFEHFSLSVPSEKEYQRDYVKYVIGISSGILSLLLNIVIILVIFFVWGGSVSNLKSIYSILSYEPDLGSTRISIINFFKFFLIIYLAFYISKIFQSFCRSKVFKILKLDIGVEHSLLTGIHYLLLVLGFFIAFDSIGIGLEGFKWMAGFIGIGLGFGMQNIVNNFISGIVLLFERPIKIGDIIKVDEIIGTVKKISVRSTLIQSLDNIEIIIPNSDLISSKVVNYTHSNFKIRLHIPIGVSYGSDVQLVKKILLSVASSHGLILNHPSPQIFFTEFADSSLNFELMIWIDHVTEMYKISSDMNYAIDKNFRKNNISIPFPQNDIYIKEIPDELKGIVDKIQTNNKHKLETDDIKSESTK